MRNPGASTFGGQLLYGDHFPWLANPGNPAMSPHAVRKAATSHTVKNSGKVNIPHVKSVTRFETLVIFHTLVKCPNR